MAHWLGKTREELGQIVAGAGQPAYRAGQLWDWLHGRRVAEFVRMLNLPAALRDSLAARGQPWSLSEVECRRTADNLTAKWLFAAPGGNNTTEEALVESVLIVEKEKRRRTVCVSSMAGCPLGCLFCATGRLGFVRDLEAGEIVEQVYRVDAACREMESGSRLSHVVFMGMGEPLLNFDATLAAAAVIADPSGLGFSGRHLTISTAGYPEGIRRLAAAGVNYRLAVSLHAPDQQTREKIMPIARTWPLGDLFAALEEFASSSSRDITFEYCLIDGVNAAPRHARDLAKLLRNFKAKVNLIPLNPIPGFDAKTPPPGKVAAFRDILEQAGVPATIRVEKGQEIGAACGQLRAERAGR